MLETVDMARVRVAANCLGVDVPVSPFLHDQRIERINAARYEEAEILGALRCVRAGDAVLELGAGLGIVGAVVARNLRPSRVRAYEANAALVPHIRALYALNGLEDVISVENRLLIAAPDRPEIMTLNITNSFLGSSVLETARSRDSVEVPTGDFNEACAEAEVLIMDIEGAELELLRHADLSHLRAVVTEFHPDAYGPEGMKEAKEILRAAGFERIDSCSTRTVWACEKRGML
ncbi:FkbM family methyltransferase [Pseudooceanicola sp.]|uniref:FkbM family methyltransferase n=1 Tax=Pseudooceanicola sp. TaxID=1914328 RepID=UPI00405849E0